MSKKTIKMISIIFAIIFVACFLSFGYTIWIHRNDDISNQLNSTLNDMLDESYIHYGDISKSNYKNIVSAKDYDHLYYMGYGLSYLDGVSENDVEIINGYISRKDIDIIKAYCTYPKTHIINDKEAVSVYYYVRSVVLPGGSHSGSGGPIEDDMGIEVTVTWNLKGNAWHIVGVGEEP